MKGFSNFFDFITKIFSLDFRITDLLDILLVAVVIFSVIRLIRDTRAFQLVKGLIVLGLGYFLVYELEMQTSTYIFKFIFQNIFVILIIVFQKEIRQIFEKLGKTKLGKISNIISKDHGNEDEIMQNAISEICKAAKNMSDKKIGALIVMEKETPLGDIAKDAIIVDAVVSTELIGNIFYPKSPLHDGAAIIKNGRVQAAGCVLPLTNSKNIPSDLGTRHRAAIGVSEVSDAIVVVVSEETGAISIALKGKITRDYTEEDLKRRLEEYLTDDVNYDDSNILQKLKEARKNVKKEKHK